MEDTSTGPVRPRPRPSDVQGALAALAEQPATWESLVRFDPVDRVRVRLPSERHESWLLTWLPGQSTPWHVHRAGAGCFMVARGELTEEVSSYPSSVDLDSPAVDPEECVTVPAPGTVTFASPRLHRLVNAGPVPAVSLHINESDSAGSTR